MIRPCKEIKRCARETLTHRYGIPMGALLVAGFIPLAIELPFSMILGENPSLFQQILLGITEFLIALVSFVLSAGITYLHLNMARKQTYQLQMVFWAFHNRPDRFIIALLLQLLLLFVGLVPALAGVALLYLPGLTDIVSISLAVLLSLISIILCTILLLGMTFLPYLLIDNPDDSVLTCLKNSFAQTKGYKGKLFYLTLSFLGLDMLNILSFGIGSLWILPYQTQTLTLFYLEITQKQD